MPTAEFEYLPPVPSKPAASFSQKILLSVQSTPIGFAAWHTVDAVQSVAQILEFRIDLSHRRLGHGKRLLDATIRQMEKYHQSHNHRLGQIWMMLRQKDEVGGRAFLTECGFHHVGSVPSLFTVEDGLIYTRAMR